MTYCRSSHPQMNAVVKYQNLGKNTLSHFWSLFSDVDKLELELMNWKDLGYFIKKVEHSWNKEAKAKCTSQSSTQPKFSGQPGYAWQ